MHETRRRGFALITTLGAVMLAMMLLGAFFSSHRGFLSLSRNDDDKQACRDSVMALAEYCRYRFEDEKDWGRVYSKPAKYVVMDDRTEVFSFHELTKEEFDESPALHDLPGLLHIVGDMKAENVSFHLAVSNNFQNSTSESTDGVRPKTCRLRIETRRGTAVERLEIYYQKTAFFDSTVAASGDIDIGMMGQSSNNLTMASTDPMHNQIRSLADVDLPKSAQIKFRPDDDDASSVRGTVWAHDKISVGGESSRAKLREAQEKTGGQFIPNGRTHYSVPELKKADISNDKPTVNLRPSVYAFNEHPVTFEVNGVSTSKVIRTFQRFEPREGDATGPMTDFYFLEEVLPPGTDFSTVRMNGHSTAAPHSQPHPDTGWFQVERGPKVNFYIKTESADGDGDDWEPAVSLPSDTNLQVTAEPNDQGQMMPGDFKVTATDDFLVPRFIFEKTAGEETKQRGYLSAENDINIEGVIVGSGQLVAGHDVRLQPNSVDVLTDMEDDIAIFAGHDVTISPPFNEDTDGSEAEGWLTFRGLVYAGNDFTFTSHEERNDRDAIYRRNLYIEGAVVANKGKVSIDSYRSVSLKYNPDFLDDFLEKKFSEDKAQIEEMSWRPL